MHTQPPCTEEGTASNSNSFFFLLSVEIVITTSKVDPEVGVKARLPFYCRICETDFFF